MLLVPFLVDRSCATGHVFLGDRFCHIGEQRRLEKEPVLSTLTGRLQREKFSLNPSELVVHIDLALVVEGRVTPALRIQRCYEISFARVLFRTE